MKKSYLIILLILICLVITLGWGWKNIISKNTQVLFTPLPITRSTPTLIPTPTPPVFNQGSNLLEELNKVTPPDFSSDYNSLIQEIGTF